MRNRGRRSNHFLKQYPNTEFSDNAQFWIGECYYFEKKYEKAIIEYDKVIKNFPEGNKVPYALLKQGLSFLQLGDKASAKLLLQQVIKDFPNTSQARIARTRLARDQIMTAISLRARIGVIPSGTGRANDAASSSTQVHFRVVDRQRCAP